MNFKESKMVISFSNAQQQNFSVSKLNGIDPLPIQLTKQ